MIKETKLSNTPFDMYDIFGYIVPGLIFLFFSLLIFNAFIDDFPLESHTMNYIHNMSFQDIREVKDNFPWWLELTFLISTISVIYIFGHIIASISSLLIDKYLVKKIAGYPSQKLFSIPNKMDFSIGFYKFIFLVINVYLLRLMFLPLPFIKEIVIVISLLSFIIIGKLVLSSKLLQSKQSIQGKLNSFGRLLAWPFNFIITFVESSFSLNESFNDDFIQNYKNRFREIFQLDLEKANTNIYWLSYCFVIERNEHMKDTIRHFLRLYGFTRNLSTAFFMLFLLILSIKLNGCTDQYRMNLYATVSLFFSTIFIIRYYYLYYNYYSKFIFRAFLYLANSNKKN